MRVRFAALMLSLVATAALSQAAPTGPQHTESNNPQTSSPTPPQEQTAPPATPGQITGAVAPGVTPPSPTNTITRNVRLVVLDMVVVDSKGNAVTDLTRDNFHVTEDDEPQEIRNFDPPGKYTIDTNATVNSTADLDRIAPRAPVNIVLLDEFNTRFEDMAFARYSLQKWLKSQPDKLATPTMLVAVSLTNFEVLHDYTQNKAAILSSLDHHFSGYPWQAHNFAWVAERYATAFLTLRRVAEATIGHPGHKNMIWIGRGFPTVNRTRFSIDDETRLNSVVQQTINELRDARVTLYTIDPAGLMIDPSNYGTDAALFSPFGGDPDFEKLAQATGGRSLHGRNDVDAEIGKSIRDGASIYTLTYRPTDTMRDRDKFRHIKVTVDRPGYTVVTRQGYFQERRPARLGNQGEMSRRLATELYGAQTSNMVYDAVPFTVQTTGTPDTYKFHVEPQGLVWSLPQNPGERRTTKIIVLATSFDKKGKRVDLDARSLQLSAPVSAPATGRINVPADFPYTFKTSPKAVRARIVLRVDATGRMGTADLALGQAAGTLVKSGPTSPQDVAPPTPPNGAQGAAVKPAAETPQ